MANNPYVNKVQFGSDTIMDLTSDTVSPEKVLQGETFHDRSGAPQQGALITHNVIDSLDSTSSTDALSAAKGKELNDQFTALGLYVDSDGYLCQTINS